MGPVVLVARDDTLPLVKEEIFGPVMCVLPFKTEDEVRLKNSLHMCDESVQDKRISHSNGDFKRRDSVALISSNGNQQRARSALKLEYSKMRSRG